MYALSQASAAIAGRVSDLVRTNGRQYRHKLTSQQSQLAVAVQQAADLRIELDRERSSNQAAIDAHLRTIEDTKTDLHTAQQTITIKVASAQRILRANNSVADRRMAYLDAARASAEDQVKREVETIKTLRAEVEAMRKTYRELVHG